MNNNIKYKKVRSPKIAEWLLNKMLPGYLDDSAIGDYQEIYNRVYKTEGRIKAVIWYWQQILKNSSSYIRGSLFWRFAMFKNYLKVAFRTLKRQKGFSIINITGLSIGMACTFLILFWVQDELSYDKFHKNRDNIYRIIYVNPEIESPGVSGPLAPLLKSQMPEVVNAARIRKLDTFIFKFGDKAFYEKNGLGVDGSFLEIFSFELIEGDPKTALSQPLNIVITEELAQKYFGAESVLNKSLNIEGRANLTVTGVIKNIPSNSHLKFDYLVSYKLIEAYRICSTGWGSPNFSIYLRLNRKVEIDQFSEKMTKIAADGGSQYLKVFKGNYSIQPLNDIHLNPVGKFDYVKGNEKYVYVFSAIGFFILIIACINYINLSTARSEKRSREVGLRKVVGARRIQMVRQFFGESIIFVFIAFFIAVILIFLIRPVFNNLTSKNLSVDFINLKILFYAFAIFLFTGIISGSYPALFLSSFKPVDVLKGGGSVVSFIKKSVRGGLFRKILVVFQFSMSIILIICTLVVLSQLNYIMDKSWQSEDSYLVHIPIKENIGIKYDFVKSELLKNPSVFSVSVKDCLPTEHKNRTTGVSWEGKPSDDNRAFETTRAGIDYFKTLDMKIVEGRTFSEEMKKSSISEFILNEQAVKQMGTENPVGKSFNLYNNPGIIIGIVENTYFKNLKRKYYPVAFHLLQNIPRDAFFGSVFIKVKFPDSENHRKALSNIISYIEGVWKQVNSLAPFEYHFLDETVEAQYENEHQLQSLFGYLASIAIIISCLGLFGLASFTAERKTKEIGIRKAMGATTFKMVSMLSKEFTRWIIFANIFAWPIAYYAMNKWLQSYEYRTNIGFFVFVLAGVIALIIALITTSYQAFKAAKANPVDSLRYE